jgi:spore germination protein GerM
MRKALPFILILVLAFAGLGVYFARRTADTGAPGSPQGPGAIGSQQPEQPDAKQPEQTEISVPVLVDNEFKMKKRKVKLSGGGDPVAKTLEALLATGDENNTDSAIPPSTKLQSVKVDNGLATVDLSEDFKMLNKRGDTVQSLAQQQLRAALAQFPDIKKMRVTVDGKVFEDGHSGAWDDIPVRGTIAAGGSEGAE